MGLEEELGLHHSLDSVNEAQLSMADISYRFRQSSLQKELAIRSAHRM